jgi:uncharacterized protein (DUF2141 family)
MKRIITLFFLVFAIINLHSEEMKGNLTVIIKDLRNDKGTVRVALFNSEKDFPGNSEKSVARQVVMIKNGVARAEFKDCVYGTYAIAFYHDENVNEKMDTGLFGIPLEGYGFSNDARGILGPASFKDASFKIKASEKEIILTISY